LDARGFDVDVVGDGLAAIDHISQTRPSLVLLDLFMPGADGFDVLRKLKGDDATADIPVIILTGADGESSVVKAFELGAADYVVKPFSPAELMVRIERFFR
jgi:DNA-binding response OmpR family regulator